MSVTPQDVRPARQTPRLKLPIPGDDGPADAPTDIGALADAIDLLFAPGDLKMSAALEDAPGWLLCDGRAISRAAFPDLFTRIGTAYGAGDGSTTFNIPPLSRRFPVGAGAGIAAGAQGGEEAHALALGEMPSHAHGGTTGGMNAGNPHAHGPTPAGGLYMEAFGAPAGQVIPAYGSASNIGYPTTGWTDINHSHPINAEGGGGAHNNMPPYVGVNFFIKT